MDRLIVKNFGPLKDVDIELNKINLFIGENGSGKSILGKLLVIVKSEFLKGSNKEVLQEFNNYNINYLSKKTNILYVVNNKEVFQIKEGNLLSFKYISFTREEFEELDFLKETFDLGFQRGASNDSNEKKQLRKKLSRIMRKNPNDLVKKPKHYAQYIPAERNLISLFNKSLTTLLVAEVPLPKFLLEFSSEFEKAGNELKELEFLNVKYINGDGLDRHKVYFNNDDYLPLEQSSSGIQSVLPLYLTVKYFANRHNSIIIEEPEQNLFPKAQAETIKYIVEQVSDKNSLFMMTHSPYVLSTLNNLLYAYIVAQLGEKEKAEVTELIAESQWINPDDFSAYYLENGVARSIKSDIGLISDNEIDNISEEMGEEFDELLEIYRASKND